MIVDFVVVGAGSAGCALAFRLAQLRPNARIAVLEAGPTDKVPQVKVPFGLLFTMGSGRDWGLMSVPQPHASDRRIKVTRGKMVGGSSAINSMVWFRGRRDDFDNWGVPGWAWSDIEDEYDAVERLVGPGPLPDPHPVSQAFGRSMHSNAGGPPTPEHESAGVFDVNMRNGARRSAADAFLTPALAEGQVTLHRGAPVDRVETIEGRARAVILSDGTRVEAQAGVILSAGAIASPAILLRSGIGPGAHLSDLGIEVTLACDGIGADLHDHPAVGLHHEGEGSGYGLTLRQMPAWLASPFQWLVSRTGRMTSNFVEAGAFFRAAASEGGDGRPDCQVHFIPYKMGYQGKLITQGEGYFADVCVSRPVSRGRVSLNSADPAQSPAIDLGLFANDRDLDLLTQGVQRLRRLLAQAPFGDRTAPEVYPGPDLRSFEDIKSFARSHAGTSYHPVGSLRMGEDTAAPVNAAMGVKGIDGLWVADASVMPAITSANTNAPSMMIGYRAARFIARAVR